MPVNKLNMKLYVLQHIIQRILFNLFCNFAGSKEKTMINYCTRIDIPKSVFDIGYQDRLMFIGSCFADQTGLKMVEHGWDACVNPFGVLYNPLSVATGCYRLLKPEPFVDSDLFEYNRLFHSFMHHGQFSGQSVEATLAKMNDSLAEAASYFSTMSCLVITFGTAYVYRLKSDGRTVANCHKLPAAYFDRELLTVDRIVGEWSVLLETIRSVNTSLKVIFTVSPIRHWKEGAHGNQISKSILLLAEQTLVEKYPRLTSYFPSYELMMDELRDYRFYADDLLHPSKVAVDYIWERFCEAYLGNDVIDDLKEFEAIHRDIHHRPYHPSSASYKHFLMQTLLKIKRLKAKNSYICTSKQEKEIIDRLQELS